MSEEGEQPKQTAYEALCERLDKACVRLLEKQFPDSVPTAGSDAQTPEIDVEGSIKVFEAALNYLKWREKQEVAKTTASPPKSGLAVYHERLSGASSGRGSIKSSARKAGDRRNGATARIAVEELPSNSGAAAPEHTAVPDLN